MPFTLRIKLTGLITFVPMKNNGKVVYDVADPPDYVWALLLNAQNPQPNTDADRHKLDFHLPALRYDEANAVGGKPGFPSRAFPGCYAAFPYSNDIVLPSGVAGERPTIDPADFNKLASLREILPNAMPNASYLGPKPQSDLLSGRLKIERGTLKVLDMELGEVKFDRLPEGSTYWPRELAKTMLLTIEGLSDSITIEFKPFGSGGPHPSLGLAPRTGCGGVCEIELELMNSPQDWILHPRRYEPNSLRHFEMYWKVVDSPGTRAAPLHQHLESEFGIFTGDLLCPETRP